LFGERLPSSAGSARRSHRAMLLALTAGASIPLTACGSSSPSQPDPAGIAVKASDTACQVDVTTLAAGTQTFAVSNAGSQVTEVYVYAAGDRVVGEVGNIGPSTNKKLTVALKAGHYQLACKPGMVGAGIRTAITVKAPSGAAPTTSPELDAAVASYRSYVVSQARLLSARTKPFTAAVIAGDIPKAKSLYASAHIPYDTIQPVVASLGDLDPRIDARIDDVENGQEWTGFHRLEHDLWKSRNVAPDAAVARQLQSDVAQLVDQVQRVELSADQISNAAKSLVQQAVKIQVTGQEERYSRLDLVDCSAGIQGSFVAYQALRPIVINKDPSLVERLDTNYAQVQLNLSQYGSGANFVLYDALSKAQVRLLSTDVEALQQPLSDLTTATLKA
jgi:iron uptake system component EfeO